MNRKYSSLLGRLVCVALLLSSASSALAYSGAFVGIARGTYYTRPTWYPFSSIVVGYVPTTYLEYSRKYHYLYSFEYSRSSPLSHSHYGSSFLGMMSICRGLPNWHRHCLVGGIGAEKIHPHHNSEPLVEVLLQSEYVIGPDFSLGAHLGLSHTFSELDDTSPKIDFFLRHYL